MKYALTQAGVKGLVLPTPQPSLDFGYYYPADRKGAALRMAGASRTAGARVPASPAGVRDVGRVHAWRQAHGKLRPGAPRIAVGFYKSTYYSGETELLDAVIAEIERQGAEAIPMFGYPGAIAAERLLLDPTGQPRADAALGFLFNFAAPDSSSHLAKVDIPVLNLISLYGRTEKEWRASSTGLSLFEGTFQVAVPELAGTIAPTVVGSQEKDQGPRDRPDHRRAQADASQVALAVRRATEYAALRSKANRDKHVAIVFYNYPAGKANIGASYLNVAESLANILQRLKQEGYDVGTADLSGDSVLQTLVEKARNVGGYAPGELEALVAQGSAVRVGVAEYRRWLDALSPGLRAKILKDWGAPEKTRLMTTGGSIVIPAVQYGNVVLLPQPARGWGEDAEKMYHAKDLAPHHQYVATYAWLRDGFKADAVVHVGTHGTLEWLDGKDMGLSADDAPDALIADLPDLYIYNVDVVGEGLVARRRGMATLIDHMVPPFKKGGLYPELAELGERISDYDTSQHKNPELAKAVGEQIREQVIALGIAKDLSLDLTKPDSLTDRIVHQVQNHLLELKGQNIPYGLHTFGRVPEKPLRERTIDAIVSVDRSLLPNKAKVLAAEMEQRIVSSGARELDNLVRGLRGGFVPAGSGGEPIRNPDAYPTGKNFYGIDPDKVPKPASWELGVKLAEQMLADHVKKHGKYPEKVSFVIWGDETMRHEGVLESQIFYLLGTKPVWDVRGKVVDVEVIPRAQLGRPRVDIVIASAAEGMFHNVTMLMDKAVQKVKAIDEAENFVRRHYLATKAILMQRGYSEEDADRRAGVRIFDEPPGIFNLNTSTIVAASGTWDTDKGMADDYIRKLGHGYGNGFWGEPMEDVFRLALSGTEKVVHSSSTMLYGALDNDDMFMYMGGLATAIRNIDGEESRAGRHQHARPRPAGDDVDRQVHRHRVPVALRQPDVDRGHEEGRLRRRRRDALVRRVPVGLGRDRARDRHDGDVEGDVRRLRRGQAQARHEGVLRAEVAVRVSGHDRAHGRDGAQGLLEGRRRHAEEAARGVRREREPSRRRLRRAHLRQPAPAEVRDRAGRRAGIPVPALEGFQQAMEKATGQAIDPAAESQQSFAQQNDAQMAANLSTVPAPSRTARKLEGYLMEERAQEPRNEARRDSAVQEYAALWASMPLLACLVAWRYKRRRMQCD